MTRPLSRDVRIANTTLRDGSHAMAHQFTASPGARHRPGARHGRRRGRRGRPRRRRRWRDVQLRVLATDEMRLIAAAAEEARRRRSRCCSCPASAPPTTCGAPTRARRSCAWPRTAPRPTSRRSTSASPASWAWRPSGFLMLSHMTTPEELARQARIMVDAGCQCPYVVDSAGALILDEATDRVDALVAEVGDEAQVGYHGHNNLRWASRTRSSRTGGRPADRRVDARARRGSGQLADRGAHGGLRPPRGRDRDRPAGNPRGGRGGRRPYLRREPTMDRSSIMLGYAGAYSSFLIHAERAAERYGVPAHEILAEVRRARPSAARRT